MDVGEIPAMFMTFFAYLGIFSMILALWVWHVIQTREHPRRRVHLPSVAPAPPHTPDATITAQPAPAQAPPQEARRVSFCTASCAHARHRLGTDGGSARSSLESSMPPTPLSGDGVVSWRSRASTLADIPSADASTAELTPVTPRRATLRLPFHVPLSLKRRSASLPPAPAAGTPLRRVLSTPPSPLAHDAPPTRPRSPPPYSVRDADAEHAPKRGARALRRVVEHLRVHRRARSSPAVSVPAALPTVAPEPVPPSPRTRFALMRRLTLRASTPAPAKRTDPYGPEYNAAPPLPREHHHHLHHAHPAGLLGAPRTGSPVPRFHDTDTLVKAVTQKLSAHILVEQQQQRAQAEPAVLFSY